MLSTGRAWYSRTMKRIKLTQGYTAMVDDEDYQMLQEFSWFVRRAHKAEKMVAARTFWDGEKKTIIYMHRYIVDAAPGENVLHISEDGLDNRRKNLRVATASQTRLRDRRRKGESKYKGVSWSTLRGKWRARVIADGNVVFVEFYDTEKEAARAYNAYAVDAYKDARINEIDGVSRQQQATAPPRKPRDKPTSRYTGVHLDKRAKRRPWVAEVRHHGRNYSAGRYATQREAAEARDELAKEILDEAAVLNFPPD